MKLRVFLKNTILLMALAYALEASSPGQTQTRQDGVQTLNEMGLLSEAIYQELTTAVEQGYDTSRAAILQRIADDLSQRSLSGYGIDLGAQPGDADILMTIEEAAQLRHLIDRLNAVGEPSEDDMQQLQSFFNS